MAAMDFKAGMGSVTSPNHAQRPSEGRMPGYKGYIPGRQHVYGKTFQEASASAVRNLHQGPQCSTGLHGEAFASTAP